MRTKQKVMLDGARVGTALEDVKGSIELDSSEYKIIKQIFIKAKVKESIEMILAIKNKLDNESTMHLVLRRHIHQEDKWYLNLSGNPLTFFEDSNTYGWPEADEQILKAFKYCITYAQKKARMYFPLRIRSDILNLDFHINSLEFASYTHKVKDKAQILNAWDYMYSSSNSYDGLKHKSLEKLLNVNRNNRQYDTSFSLELLRDKKVESMLTIYDKELEMLNRNVGLENIPLDIKDRLRVDLNLCSYWFKQRSIKTMRQFVIYVDSKGGWENFIKSEMMIAFNRTCLLHMFTFPAESIINSSYKLGDNVNGLNSRISLAAYQAMLYARASFYVTDDDKMQALLGNSKPMLAKLKTKALPNAVLKALTLDTGLLND
jgi:hypothetical protein